MPDGWVFWLTFSALAAGTYLVGAIPFGLLIGFCRKTDIRKHGSGNIGATNAGRVLGRPWGLLAFVLDVAKGFVPILLGGALLRQIGWGSEEPTAGFYLLWSGLATVCILGHVFPVYLRFKGGKGVATSLGVLLGVYPYYTVPGLAAFAVWLVVVMATRYVSVASVSAAVGFPIIFSLFAYRQGLGSRTWPLYLFAVLVAILVVYRHRSNLRRWCDGTEPKIGASSRRQPTPTTNHES